MALMHGKEAKIYWDADDTDTNLQHGQSWSADIEHNVAEVTSMQDTWKTYLTGFQDWTATVTCLLDSGGVDIGIGGDDGFADDECRLELYFWWEAATKFRCIYGSAICNGLSVGADKDGIPTVTYTFQGAAQLQWHSGATEPA